MLHIGHWCWQKGLLGKACFSWIMQSTVLAVTVTHGPGSEAWFVLHGVRLPLRGNGWHGQQPTPGSERGAVSPQRKNPAQKHIKLRPGEVWERQQVFQGCTDFSPPLSKKTFQYSLIATINGLKSPLKAKFLSETPQNKCGSQIRLQS